MTAEQFTRRFLTALSIKNLKNKFSKKLPKEDQDGNPLYRGNSHVRGDFRTLWLVILQRFITRDFAVPAVVSVDWHNLRRRRGEHFRFARFAGKVGDTSGAGPWPVKLSDRSQGRRGERDAGDESVASPRSRRGGQRHRKCRQ